MSKTDEDISFLAELPLEPTEPQGFSPNQMVRCEQCLRANPPTRAECLYCGQELPLSPAATALVKPSLRPPEKWEQGYNCVLLKAADLSKEATDEVASLIRLEGEQLRKILCAGRALPLARTATHAEAVIIEERLTALGLETMTISDEMLAPEGTAPRRLRTMDFNEEGFVAYQVAGTEGTFVDWSVITLVVTGRLYARQLAYRERKRRGAEKEIVAATETASDEAVLDIYTAKQDGGWRIAGNNFDFSCLAERKTLLAHANFLTLRELICERASNAEHDDSFANLRRVLEFVWPSEQLTESRGWHRDLRGKYGTSEVTVTSNEPQFTRYSQLCQFLKTTRAQQR